MREAEGLSHVPWCCYRPLLVTPQCREVEACTQSACGCEVLLSEITLLLPQSEAYGVDNIDLFA